MHIDLDGLSITIMKKKIKNINLRIQRSGEIHVSAPVKTPLNTIYQFLNEKRQWIEDHRHRLRKIEQARTPSLNTGDPVYFKGQTYTLHIHEAQLQGIQLIDSQLQLFIQPQASHTDKQTLLTQWYHTQMRQHLPALFKQWEKTIGVSAKKVTIKTMKTRWGSCNPINKHISLNLRLIEKPLVCLEYVIVHELVHLLEASHNHRFYALMDHYLPHWKQIKSRLDH